VINKKDYMNSELLFYKKRLQSGFKIKLINEPDDYALNLKLENPGINLVRTLHEKVDVIQLFVKWKKELTVELNALKNYLNENGLLIVAWPDLTKSATDLDEPIVRNLAETNQLSVIQSFTLNENWNALELSIRNLEIK
jgi:hypothetical protein